jgi:hypothetical protein
MLFVGRECLSIDREGPSEIKKSTNFKILKIVGKDCSEFPTNIFGVIELLIDSDINSVWFARCGWGGGGQVVASLLL